MSKNIRILNCDWLKKNYSCDLEAISSGSFGAVYSIEMPKTKEKKAVKVITRDQFEDRELWINECIKEVLALHLLTLENNPYSVKLENFYIGLEVKWEFNISGKINLGCSDMIFLVMEKADSNLSDILKKGFPLEKMENLVTTLIKGLEPAHKRNFVHRDIKPQNILYFQKEDTFKIADWGISRFLQNKGTEKTQNAFGTKEYLPPEFDNLKEDKPFDANFFKTDIFSCGQIIMEACGMEYRNTVRRNGKYHDSDIQKEWCEKFKKPPGFEDYKDEFKKHERMLDRYNQMVKDMCCFETKARLDIDKLINKFYGDSKCIEKEKKRIEKMEAKTDRKEMVK